MANNGRKLKDGAVWGRGMRDNDRVIAFAWFALAVAIILGFIGFSRPLRASLNPSVSVVHVEAPSTIVPPTQN